MQIRTTRQNKTTIASIKKGDTINLEILDHADRKTHIKVVVSELTDGITKCASCGCLLRTKEDKYEFGKGIYCEFCFGRKKERMRELAALSSKKRS